MKVLFLTQTPASGASARYRVYQYINYLQDNGIECTVAPAISEKFFKKYLASNASFNKAKFYLYQLLKRLKDSVGVHNYNVVFLQRDIIVHLYPFVEKIIKIFNKNIIFDFDDAIYLFPSSKKPNFIFNLFWDKRKTERIIKLSRQVIVGNKSLYLYAKQFCSNLTIIPTSIDLALYDRLKILNNNKLHIGWIGSHGTTHYLRSLSWVFRALANKYNIILDVVGGNSDFSIDGVKVLNKRWSLDTEIEDIYKFDIGIMPLTDDEWSRGKSATKILQCMAAGIPVVCSAVGANCDIVKDGENGFLAGTEEEWVKKLSLLIENQALREKLGKAGRIDVKRNYSIEANAPKLLNVLKVAAGEI